jgi:hypothetical protein
VCVSIADRVCSIAERSIDDTYVSAYVIETAHVSLAHKGFASRLRRTRRDFERDVLQTAHNTMSRLMRPPYIDPDTGVAYDTDKGEYEGYLTKQSMWLRVSDNK